MPDRAVRLGDSALEVFPLALGGNVFGWTADRETSFAILDRFHAGGGTFVDTADAYSSWVPGHSGGESERIIGAWLASRKARDVVVATKVGQHPDFAGLSAKNIRAAAEASLRRLGVETLDLYYAHFDDPSVPLDETVAAFGELVTSGLVRYTALSNYSADRIREWIVVARATDNPQPVVLQPQYNLVHRTQVEQQIAPVADEFGLSLVPYASLARGFLTGKYRATATTGHASPRAKDAVKYATPLGLQVLDALDEIGRARGVSAAVVSLAWLRAQPNVAAPIASASHTEQVGDLLASVDVVLTSDEVALLSSVSNEIGRYGPTAEYQES